MEVRSLPISDLWRGGWAFEDRDDAGRRLALVLAEMRLREPVVLGLPRGGVPVAARIALELHAPLDVLIVRKLGVPAHPEVAMGAIGEGGARVIDDRLIRTLAITPEQISAVERREMAVLEARVARLRRGRPPLRLEGRTAVIVDDGIATGATATAACQVALAKGAAHVIVAVPVAAPDGLVQVRGADEVVCLLRPRSFEAVGEYYRHFEPTSDDEVAAILDVSRPPGSRSSGSR